MDDPESLCSTVSWDDTTDKVKWVYKVQDTPGDQPGHINHSLMRLTGITEDH